MQLSTLNIVLFKAGLSNCLELPCQDQNGECVFELSGIRCRCDIGYSGINCDGELVNSSNERLILNISLHKYLCKVVKITKL